MNDSGAADLARAEALIDLRRFADAKVILAAAGSRGAAPTSRGWCLMAQCELGLGSGAGSLWATEQALRLDPENEWAHRLRSSALLRGERYWEAELAALEALRLAPSSFFGFLSLANVFLASPGKSYRAFDPAQRAVELGPHSADSHLVYGMALSARGRRRSAKRAYLKALEIDPEHVGARNNLGVLALRSGRAGLASDLFVATIRSDPRSTLGQKNLGIAYRALLVRLQALSFGVFLATWLTAAIDGEESRGWPGARAAVLVVGVLLAMAVLARQGSLARASFAQMWMFRSLRWRLAIPVGFALAALVVVLLPSALLGWTVLLVPLLIGGYGLAETKAEAWKQRERWV